MNKKKKNEALGGNYKIKDVKVFGSKENLFQNEKKYRRVFDQSEATFIYCELSFFNKLFDEESWDTNIKLICRLEGKDEPVCEINKELPVPKDQNVIFVREGWGTPDPGWWNPGTYEWEVFIDQKSIGKTQFYIIDGGAVTPDENPYFEIDDIRLFESPKFGAPLGEREYLEVFAADETRYINIEMRVKNTFRNEGMFPLEVTFYVHNDAGQFKASMQYFKVYENAPDEIQIDAGYGAEKPGFWYEDNYTIEVVFMDTMIAVVPFEVASEPVKLEGEQTYSELSELQQMLEEETTVSFEEAKEELEDLIGLESVKKQINELAAYLQFLKVRHEKGIEEDQAFSLHSVFTGNPGTGKTTVAHMLGKIYKSLGLLSHGGVMEVGRAELVGEFIGQTAPKVKKALEKARGGILFVDEAYALTSRGKDGKDFGQEVIEVLLKEMSDGEGDIAIIFAGYTKEMQEFIQSNPGLASRLRNVIHFPDYTPDELLDIAQYTAGKKGVILSQNGLEELKKHLVEAYRNRDEQFGNARFVVGIIDEAKQRMALRLIQSDEEIETLSKEELSTIRLEDIQRVFQSGSPEHVLLPIDEGLLNDALEQLHELVGLDDIKQEIEELVKLVRYYREVGKDVKNAFSMHSVFMGNPGTGKTTIARLMVLIYKALGILDRGHLVEVDRKSLVAGYVGQTAIKTGEMIDKAMGGGLFIDEAYSLVSGGERDFGREAIETLLKRMEDQRGEFMVIVAGYPEEMKTFIEANPGLMSRFDKKYVFPDYSVQELMEIGILMFEKRELHLNQEALEHFIKYIERLVENKHKYFGNARTIRKIVAETVRRQNLRMANTPPEERTDEMKQEVTLEDVSSFKLMEEDTSDRPTIGFKREDKS